MPLERKDIIADDALQSPLLLAENFEELKKSLVAVYDTAEKGKQAIDNAKNVNDVKDAVIALTAEQKELAKIQNQIATAAARNNDEYRAYEEELKRIKKETKEAGEASKGLTNNIKAESTSIKQLGASLSENKKAYAELTSAEQRNSKEGKALLAVIKAQDKEYKELHTSMGNNKVMVGGYTQAIQAALAPLSVFGIDLGLLGTAATTSATALEATAVATTQVGTGSKGAAVGARILRMAMIAIPIVALVTAIVSLISYFTKTQEGAEKLRVAMAVVSGVVGLFLDKLIAIGKAITEITWDSFVDGLKSIGTAIYDYVISKFEAVLGGLKSIGKAFSLAFSGKWEEAAQAAADGAKVLFMNLTGVGIILDLVNKAWEAMGGIIDEVLAKIDEETKIQMRANKLIRERRAFIVEEARLQNALAVSREKIADQNIKDEEKLLELKKQRALVDEMEQKRLALLEEELAIIYLRDGEKIENSKKYAESIEHVRDLTKQVAKETASLQGQTKEQQEQTLKSSDLKKKEIEALKVGLTAEEEVLDKVAELEKEILNVKAEAAGTRRKIVSQETDTEISMREKAKKAALDAIEEVKDARYEAANDLIKQAQAEMDKEIDIVKQKAIAGIYTRESAEQTILEIQKHYGAKVTKATIQSLSDQLRAQKLYDQAILDDTHLTAEEKEKLLLDSSKIQEGITANLVKAEQALNDQLFNYLDKRRGKSLEDQYKATQEFLGKVNEIYQAFGEGVGSMFSTLTENRLAEIDIEKNALQEQLDAQLEAAGDNEEEKQKLKEDFAKKQADLDRQRIAAQRRQAVFDKAMAAIQAGINTALAVTEQLATGNIPGAIAIGIFGAAQVAAIMAKAIPAFLKGGTLNKDSAFIAGEKGAEIVAEPSGKMYLTQNRAGLYQGPKGTKIFSHEKSMRALALAGLSNGGGMGKEKDSEVILLAKKLDRIDKTIRTKPALSINFSRQGAEAVFRNAENRIKFLNQFFK